MVVERSAAGDAEPLLPAVVRGEPGAVPALIARYGGLIWSLARRFDASDAEDAVQEIFLDVWRHAARFDPTIASEPTFLAMIARRRLIDRRRRRERRPETPVGDDLPVVIDEGITPLVASEAAQAARALDQLRPEQREVLVLATCHGLSHAEISARTGLALGTVKAHARRGLIAVRNAIFGKKEAP